MTEDCDPNVQDCEMMMDDHHEEDGHGGGHGPSPMMANVSITILTCLNLLTSSLAYFRYKSYESKMDYYSAGDAPNTYADAVSTNWWKMSNDVRSAGSLLTWGVLFITQALSMAGILADVNVMAFMYLIPVWALLNGISTLIAAWGREKAWSYWNNDNSKTAAADMADKHESELWMWPAKETYVVMALWVNHEAWFKGQYKMMTEEQQEKFKEGHDDEDDMEEMNFRKFYLGF